MEGVGMYENGFERLVGQTVIGIDVVRGEDALRIHLKNSDTVKITTSGDCCSETWFSDITGVAALLGGTITAVRERPIGPDPKDGRTRQDEDILYGFDILTDKGSALIEFRNSSNGYYGGSWQIQPAGTACPGEWVPIVEDWRA